MTFESMFVIVFPKTYRAFKAIEENVPKDIIDGGVITQDLTGNCLEG